MGEMTIEREAAASHADLIASLEKAEAENARLREALRPFARIKPSSFYPQDGSEAEPYVVVLARPHERPDLYGTHLARARALTAHPVQGD